MFGLNIPISLQTDLIKNRESVWLNNKFMQPFKLTWVSVFFKTADFIIDINFNILGFTQSNIVI
jgi:hypothetical protein